MQSPQSIKTSLFCKPKSYQGSVCLRSLPDGATLSLKSLNIVNNLSTIHSWVNQPYASFWQMAGPINFLKKTYESVLQNPSAHSFVGFYNNTIIGLADLYTIAADELSTHLPNDQGQAGIHLLMAPPRHHPARNISLQFLRLILDYYFSFPQAEKIFGEPDHLNEKIHLLVKKAGFTFVKQIQLSSKTANIFCITREQYLATRNISNLP